MRGSRDSSQQARDRSVAPPFRSPDVSSFVNGSTTDCPHVTDRCRRNKAVRIFISYAAEQRSIADSLAVSLRQEGHEVFFDRDALPDSEAYHARIRNEIDRCDLFVFLVSEASLEKSSYARTELDLARSRWPTPSGRVLPVIVERPSVEIPAYLSAVTFVEPEGNLVADTLASVARITVRHRQNRQRKLLMFAGAALLVAGVALYRWLPDRDGGNTQHQAEACQLVGIVRSTAAIAPPPGDYVLDATYRGVTHSFLVDADGSVQLDLPALTPPDNVLTISLRNTNGEVVATQALEGCPRSEQVLFEDRLQLVLRPR